MGAKTHAMHGRDHGPNGADPIPSMDNQMPRAQLVSSGRNNISADIDEFVFDSGSYGEWDFGSTDTFQAYTDSDGVYGLEILRVGFYLATWSTAFTWYDIATNPTRLVPPFVALYPNVLGSGTHFNAVSDPWPLFPGPQAIWNTPAEFSIPGTNQSTDPHAWIFIGGSTVLDISTLPRKYTMRIITKGTAHKWAYSGSHSLTHLRIHRLGTY